MKNPICILGLSSRRPPKLWQSLTEVYWTRCVQTQVTTLHFWKTKRFRVSNATTPVMFYKYGGKQPHYFNTYDGQGEMEFKEEETTPPEPRNR